MDKSKFALLMCNKRLWFSRADLLGDDHEGSLPDSMIEKRKLKWTNNNIQNLLENGSRAGRMNVYVSCWSMQDPKSLAMWNIYTPKGTGVAIRSTVGKLSTCFIKRPNDLFEIILWWLFFSKEKVV